MEEGNAANATVVVPLTTLYNTALSLIHVVPNSGKLASDRQAPVHIGARPHRPHRHEEAVHYLERKMDRAWFKSSPGSRGRRIACTPPYICRRRLWNPNRRGGEPTFELDGITCYATLEGQE